MEEKDLIFIDILYDYLKDDIQYILSKYKKQNVYVQLTGDICSVLLATMVSEIAKENPNKNYNIIGVIMDNAYMPSHEVTYQINNSLIISDAFCNDTITCSTNNLYRDLVNSIDIDNTLTIYEKERIQTQINHTYLETLCIINNGILLRPTCLTDCIFHYYEDNEISLFDNVWIHDIYNIVKFHEYTDNNQKDIVESIIKRECLDINVLNSLDELIHKYIFIDGSPNIDNFIAERYNEFKDVYTKEEMHNILDQIIDYHVKLYPHPIYKSFDEYYFT